MSIELLSLYTLDIGPSCPNEYYYCYNCYFYMLIYIPSNYISIAYTTFESDSDSDSDSLFNTNMYILAT